MTGIPPLIGFLSKWALAEAAFLSGGLLPMLGVIALLISALLTGIYLMVPSVSMYTRPSQGNVIMPVEAGFKVALVSLTALMLALSFYSIPLVDYLARTAAQAL